MNIYKNTILNVNESMVYAPLNPSLNNEPIVIDGINFKSLETDWKETDIKIRNELPLDKVAPSNWREYENLSINDFDDVYSTFIKIKIIKTNNPSREGIVLLLLAKSMSDEKTYRFRYEFDNTQENYIKAIFKAKNLLNTIEQNVHFDLLVSILDREAVYFTTHYDDET